MTGARTSEAEGTTPLTAVIGPHEALAQILSEPLLIGGVTLEFDTSFAPTNRAFRPMAEFLQFDVCELALATYVQARAAGKPITLMPVSLVSRFQHDQLLYDRDRGPMTPKDLEGRRVGIRSYSQTTGVWLRAILNRQFGVDHSRIDWIVFEEPHVRGTPAPPNVELVDDDMDAMFARGDLDAAIGIKARRANVRPLIEPLATHARAWYAQENCVTVNHAIAIREEVLNEHPDAMDALYELMKGTVTGHPSRVVDTTGDWTWAKGVDMFPVGFDALAPTLELIAEEAFRQGVIRDRIPHERLVHSRSRQWN